MRTIIIGISELNIAKPPDKISTLGLGSCVGIVLYDPITKLAGMVHILLPSASGIDTIENKAKFADQGIAELLKVMVNNGAAKGSICAKIAGGANMFDYTSSYVDLFEVGRRNVQMCKEILLALNIPLVAEDIYGKWGRTITFDTVSGAMHINTIGRGECYI